MIKVVHGDYEWILCRRFKHFRHLHDNLWVMRQMAKIPVITKGYMLRCCIYLIKLCVFLKILYANEVL